MKTLLTLLLMFVGSAAYGLEPNFTLVGNTPSPAKVSKAVDLDVSFLILVGTKPVVEPVEARSPKPEGEGWQWDDKGKNWWRYSTAPVTTTFPQYYIGGCTTGNCPNGR